MNKIIPLLLILLSLFISAAQRSEAASGIRIKRLHLYFENGRAETSVKKNHPSLAAYADIGFEGTGLLQGFWEVDGRILSHVNKHLIYGKSITLETPDLPLLPTSQAGTHRVKFVITEPSQDIPLPEAIYFVTAEKFKEIFPVNLLYPEDKSEVDYSPLTFRWGTEEKAITYLISFFEENEEKPVFSAYTKKAEYKLPVPVLKNIFTPGRGYLWRVKGFDTEGIKAGESPVYRFTFK